MSEARIVWARGGEAVILAITTDSVSMRSTVPSPPGSKIEGELAGEPLVKAKFKIHGSKRQPDGSFLLDGRPVDMPREVRERIAALVQAR